MSKGSLSGRAGADLTAGVFAHASDKLGLPVRARHVVRHPGGAAGEVEVAARAGGDGARPRRTS